MLSSVINEAVSSGEWCYRLVSERRPHAFGPKVLLTSSPRSGNTFLRFLIASAYASCYGDADVDFNSLQYYCPDPPYIPRNAIRLDHQSPVVFKTHYLPLPQYRGCEVVLLYRDPLDTLTSMYSYLTGEHGKHFDSARHFLLDPRAGVRAWQRFHLSWARRSNLVICYDDLTESPDSVLRALKLRYDFPFSDVDIDVAVRNSSREKMSKSRKEKGDPKAPPNSDYDFVRTDASIARFSFADEDVAFIRSYTDSILQSLAAQKLCV